MENDKNEYKPDPSLNDRLLKTRTVMISGEINRDRADEFARQMLVLDSESSDPIYVYINSPGGSITAGMAIYDTMQYVCCDVSTICLGMAASMGAFLLAAGAKGKRFALPNSEIMIHQPSGGTQGQATEIEIHAKRILRMRSEINRILSERTGQPLEKIQHDTERDYFMSALEAKEYGLVDAVMSEHKKAKPLGK